jgi:hypothetical protein
MADEKNHVGGYSRFKKYAIIGIFTGLSLTVSSGIGLGKLAKKFGNYVEENVPVEVTQSQSAESITPPKQLEQALQEFAGLPLDQRTVIMDSLPKDYQGELSAWFAYDGATNDRLDPTGARSAALMYQRSYKKRAR